MKASAFWTLLSIQSNFTIANEERGQQLTATATGFMDPTLLSLCHRLPALIYKLQQQQLISSVLPKALFVTVNGENYIIVGPINLTPVPTTN